MMRYDGPALTSTDEVQDLTRVIRDKEDEISNLMSDLSELKEDKDSVSSNITYSNSMPSELTRRTRVDSLRGTCKTCPNDTTKTRPSWTACVSIIAS